MSRARPVEERIRTGNPQHRPLPMPKTIAGRVMPGEQLPPAPRGISPRARQAWRELTSFMVAGGIYDRGDGFAVEAAAYQLALVRRLAALVDGLDADMLADTARGRSVDPRVGHLRESLTGLRLMLGELGLTPDARTRRAELPRGVPTDDRGTTGRMRKSVGARDRTHLRAVGDDE